jgi:hypothetical protein
MISDSSGKDFYSGLKDETFSNPDKTESNKMLFDLLAFFP